MSNIPSDLKYAKSHEWTQLNSDGTITIGITDHAQAALGDLVYVEVPEAGTTFSAGEECAVVESVKAASDVYSPVAGEVIACNELLEEQPELVNTDPYSSGWLFKIKPTDASELEALMDADGYAEAVAEDS